MSQRFDGDGLVRRPDELIVEEPITIRLDDVEVATSMRTPGNDFELAVGFLQTDGQLGDAVIERVRYCATGSAVETEFNTVSVETRGGSNPKPRLGPVGSACGLCGTDAIEEQLARISALDSTTRFEPALMIKIADSMSERQDLFARTGAAHAASTFDAEGTVDLVREDIGRHNAVDKVVGRLFLDERLPADGLGLFVSGRASVEMVLKAWSAGFSALLAVSAPSALAVHAAETAGMQLAGFARSGTLNLYT